ncbi:MAG: response regulator [Anaerolineae bacterium]|nr:response regulator [Anaerolineae bacterium]
MNKPTVLLVEDEPGHVKLITRNLQRRGCEGEIKVFNDGEDALELLLRRGQYAYAELPSIILLDLNLPRVSGLEVLQQISRDPLASQIPVIILTTSDEPEDILDCHELGYREYMVKPPNYDALYMRMQRLLQEAAQQDW